MEKLKTLFRLRFAPDLKVSLENKRVLFVNETIEEDDLLHTPLSLYTDEIGNGRKNRTEF